MCRFIIEVRRQDGKQYSSESLRQLCISLWRYLRDTCRRYDLNFHGLINAAFADIRECLDSKMKELDSTNPTTKRQAEPVNPQEEDSLWDKVFQKEDAVSIQYVVYFYACKIFGLRAADEHANLNVNQFQFGSDEGGEFLQFQRRKSKTVQGGIFHKKVDPKNLKQYESKDNPRCVVKLFRKYLQLIPDQGPFYRRPLVTTAKDGQPRFSHQKVGIHTSIQKFRERMCAVAGVSGFKTGHSGKVTTSTTLYQDGFDEQLIAARTGHRSNAIRAYKRTFNRQVKEVSDALQPRNPTSTQTTATSTVSTDVDEVADIRLEKNGVKLHIKF